MRHTRPAPPSLARALVRRYLLAVLTVLAAAALAQPAGAQCPPGGCNDSCSALWMGDVNNDGAVDNEDIVIFNRCYMPGPLGGSTLGYCECVDYNFDGQIDNTDLQYLQRIVQMANEVNVKKLPRITLSEMRERKPTVQTAPIAESRFVEIRTPLGAASGNITDPPGSIQAPTVNGVVPGNPDVRVFGNGWYYLKVIRAVNTMNPSIEASGTIAVVVPLNGMVWIANPLATTTRGLSVVIDPSWVGSPLAPGVPAAVQPFLFDISPSLLSVPASAAGFTFNNEVNSNTSHMIVFRDPLGVREIPAVGQRINVTPQTDPLNTCDVAWLVPGTPEKLPPFDAVIDCVTIVRGTDPAVYGCIFGGSPSAHIGPAGVVGGLYAPPHIYRCRSAGTWTRGPDSITATSDTPFVRNPTCTTVVQGCGELNTNGTERDCFQPQTGPGCSDPDCCAAVCHADPSCCTLAWDANCANTATTVCTSCGLNPSSCYVAHQTPSCNDSNCCQQVCNIDPTCCNIQWSASCAHIASKLCIACGDSATGPCDQVHALPYCSDASCCQLVCNLDPFCCESTWDQTCVYLQSQACSGCGAVNTGNCCIVHPTPYCSDPECCESVCAVDIYCCETAWDLACTQLTLVYCPSLGCSCGSGPGCFTTHPSIPGCSDSFCCQTVCIHDPYCCLVGWDRACTNIALDLCSTNANCLDSVTHLPVLGSCFVPHAGAGCDQPGCCSQVCAIAAFAYCCNVQWDAACAAKAADICDKCGEVLAGSCFSPHGTPNCSNSVCCTRVCNIDPFCCDSIWDDLCVATALVNCVAPVSACGNANSRSCWIPNYTPGCSDSSCCTNICNKIDPYCCDTRWDAVCAKEAGYFCVPHFSWAQGSGGCLEPHPSRGCANADCSRAVCSVDPTCCTSDWDARCVSIAAAICTATGTCPSTGDCQTAHLGPGCDDSACCTGVCAADPTCCDAEWDGACVGLARQLCRTPPGADWPCPCRGECSQAHDNPGCADASCCNITCHVDPFCCEEQWDFQCAQYAREFCCGTVGCGSGCNKGCLVPHAEPYCDDPYCCDSVCRADPLCCAYSWDSICVAAAIDRCAGGCGLNPAGNCFIPHDLPGCRDGKCCSAVCKIDPTCCTIAWDAPCITLADAPAQANVCKRTACGSATAGSCCVPHDSQGCNKQACCTAVCASDPYCCDTEWDANCTDEARDVPSCGCTFACGDPCAGDCCRAHSNNACEDSACCAAVCLQDNYCCQVEWDSVCAAMARATCTGANEACPVPPCGSSLLPSCCVPGLLPNCSKLSCCTAICNVDPFCCQIQWDSACATQARSDQFHAQCGCESGGCGDPAAGSCFQVHAGDPFCADAGCCQTVCAFDPICCTVEWDQSCVDIANFFCTGGFAPILQMMSDGTREITDGRAERVPPPGWVPPRQRATPPPKKAPPAGFPKADPRTPVKQEQPEQLTPAAPPATKSGKNG